MAILTFHNTFNLPITTPNTHPPKPSKSRSFHIKCDASGNGPPPRPRRIILVRHGESEGNVDEDAYTRVADPKIELTPKGIAEAKECGRNIRAMIEKDGVEDWRVYFYVSPYKRTLQTLRGVATAFERPRIVGVKEEPRLREQDFVGKVHSFQESPKFEEPAHSGGQAQLRRESAFGEYAGNFQNTQKMQVNKALRSLYGRFFYRFPDGESAADVYDRITGFRETLRADIDKGRFQPPNEWSPNLNIIIVSHGLTVRTFLMRWYKWSAKQFEGLNNLTNGEVIVMERGYGGRYSLMMHHSEEELRRIGLTDEMIADQEWQKTARPGEVNYECKTTGPSYFTHYFEEDHKVRQL